MAASTLYTGGIFLSFETHLLSLGTLKLGSGSVIVLSSAATVKELLNKRRLQSIDRPANYLIVHIVTNDLNLGFPPHGEFKLPSMHSLIESTHVFLRRHLAYIQKGCSHNPNPPSCCAVQQANAAQLMHDVMKQPEVSLLILCSTTPLK